MEFFDSDERDEHAEPGRRPSRGDRGGDRPSRDQIRTRQLTFIAAAIVFFILLVLAFRGCLDARKERSFKNYVSDLTSITVETKQLSDGLFQALGGEAESGDLSLQQRVNGDRATAQGLLDRIVGLEAPDELSGARSDIIRSYELRRNALAEIAEQLPTALGDAGANKAIRAITGQMKLLLASDVLYSEARAAIEAELAEQEIVVDGGVPQSQFLPQGNNDPDYLDRDEISTLLAGAGGGGGGGGGDPDDGLVHGLGLFATIVQPAGITLQPGTTTTAPADGAELEVQVHNQGEATESDVTVSISGDYSGNQTISTIEADEIQSVTIPLEPAPKAGDSGSITVEVDTVPGEQVADNNTSTYDVAFE